MSRDWWYADGDAQRGPVSVEALRDLARDGRVSADTLVWSAGLPDWVALRDSPLSELAGPTAPPPPPRPRTAVPTITGSGVSLAKGGAAPSYDPAPAPDDRPLGGADAALSLWGYFVRCVTRDYVGFRGRARRREYLGFLLFSNLIVFVAAMAAAIVNETLLVVVLGILFALLLPSVAVLVRRIHDAGYTGWLALATLVPYVGFLVFVAFAFLPGEPGTNRFGPPPA